MNISDTSSFENQNYKVILNTIQNFKLHKKNVFQVAVISTKYATHFFDVAEVKKFASFYEDKDEWESWHGRGDPILHIDLTKWADLFLIAPLDANTLAKISNVHIVTHVYCYFIYYIFMSMNVYRASAITF